MSECSIPELANNFAGMVIGRLEQENAELLLENARLRRELREQADILDRKATKENPQ